MRYVFPNSIQSHIKEYLHLFILVFLITLIISPIAPAQYRTDEFRGSSNPEKKRDKGLKMLSTIKKHIKKNYYDPNYKGIDIDKRFAEAKKNIKKMDYNWQIFKEIAELILEFDDSHTRFYPPQRSTHIDYGFTMQMIGQNCFITNVKKKSDAEKKGIKPGFQIKYIGAFKPTRKNFWKIQYLIKFITPLKTLPLTVFDLNGKSQSLFVNAKLTPLEERKAQSKKEKEERKTKPSKEKIKNQNLRYKCQKINSEVITCKLKTFTIQKKQVREMMEKVNKHKKFILDLRGNNGNYATIEKYILGFFFDRKVKIGDFITRLEKEKRFVQPVKNKAFKGKLIVLIDSRSTSAAEIFARIIQIEKRGKIIGDVSAGTVMKSSFRTFSIRRGHYEQSIYTKYSLKLTIGDVIMSDGKRLESVGVTPDILIGPNPIALADRKDPVLAYAAQSFGANVDEVETGKYGFLY